MITDYYRELMLLNSAVYLRKEDGNVKVDTLSQVPSAEENEEDISNCTVFKRELQEASRYKRWEMSVPWIQLEIMESLCCSSKNTPRSPNSQ